MSQSTRYTFLIHAIIAALFGIPMLIIPGEFLPLFGWTDDVIDPLVSRVLGAAIIAMAWSSYRGWRATDWEQVNIVIEAEAMFAVLAAIGLLRHLIGYSWPAGVWLILALFVVFAIAWIVALRKK
jgi:uncharacterized membrane protein YkvA (DUF1232 family)